VDGNTGAVVGFIGRGASVTASFTLQQAADAAVKALPGTVIRVDLERELGRAIYEVQIAAGDRRIYQVAVDGMTANVLLIQVDAD